MIIKYFQFLKLNQTISDFPALVNKTTNRARGSQRFYNAKIESTDIK